MSEAPDPGAATPPERKVTYEFDFEWLKELLPALALAAALPLLIIHAVPKESSELAGQLVAGLLGFLTGKSIRGGKGGAP